MKLIFVQNLRKN